MTEPVDQVVGGSAAAGSPSARIVAEIRRRIVEGELREGDRVPSTRQITQQWGVAMATASKVLVALRQEGLVRAVPGVGTVVGSVPNLRSTSPAGRREPDEPTARAKTVGASPLSREAVVSAGISIADSEGLGVLAMRRVAAELGTATMSLYRYVQSKDDLLMEMVRTVFDRFPVPDDNHKGWRPRLEALCRLQWEAYQLHPWLAQYMSMTRPQLVPNAMAHTEWAMAALRTAGLDVNNRLHVAVVLANYVRGLAVNLEPEAQAEQDSGLTSDEWMRSQAAQMQEILASGAFPMFTEMLTAGWVELTLDTLFEFGLARLLDGITVLVDQGGNTHR